MIYFFQDPMGGPVKIGQSIDAKRRRKELEKFYRRPLVVLKVIEGGTETESEIHARFAHLRINGTEQFVPTPELAKFIGSPATVISKPLVKKEMPSFSLAPVINRMDKEVISWAKLNASNRGMTLGDYLSEAIRPAVRRDFLNDMMALEAAYPASTDGEGAN